VNASRRRHRVSLANAPQASGDADGFFEACDPPEVWADIQPLSPVASDDVRAIGHYVTIPYHAQVSLDTRVLFGTRALFVRGIQDLDVRHRELRLYCEETLR
jgi:head-tail adaptor